MSLPARVRILAAVLVLYGFWALPLGYFIGFETSTYPVPVRVALGLAGISSGIGLLRGRAWAVWPGALFVTSQLVRVHLQGYAFDPIVFIGHELHIQFVATGEAVLGINIAALALLVALYVVSAPASGAAARPPSKAPRAGRPA